MLACKCGTWSGARQSPIVVDEYFVCNKCIEKELLALRKLKVAADLMRAGCKEVLRDNGFPGLSHDCDAYDLSLKELQ
jgi:hypothetical protein